MVAKANLRAVKPGESAPRRRAMSIPQAARIGSRRDLLAALRERLSKAVSDPNCPPKDLAPLSRQLRDIDKEIRLLDVFAQQESKEDGTTDQPWDTKAL
jgi:hypothetical protein